MLFLLELVLQELTFNNCDQDGISWRRAVHLRVLLGRGTDWRVGGGWDRQETSRLKRTGERKKRREKRRLMSANR